MHSYKKSDIFQDYFVIYAGIDSEKTSLLLCIANVVAGDMGHVWKNIPVRWMTNLA